MSPTEKMQADLAAVRKTLHAMPDAERNVMITFLCGSLIKAGMSADAAVDMVMGEGSYRTITSAVYDALRAQA